MLVGGGRAASACERDLDGENDGVNLAALRKRRTEKERERGRTRKRGEREQRKERERERRDARRVHIRPCRRVVAVVSSAAADRPRPPS